MKSAHTARGFSLVELMVGMAIGLVVLLAVTSLYLTSSKGSSNNADIAAQEESGRFALNLIAKNVRMAGFTNLRTAAAYPTDSIDKYLRGCDYGYDDGTVKDPVCTTSPSGTTPASGSIETRYETDPYTSGSARGADCLGNAAFARTTAAGGVANTVVNRFFVARQDRKIDARTHSVGQLYCVTVNLDTSDPPSVQPIVEGIDQVNFRYRIASTTNPESASISKTAAELTSADLWDQVTSVEICVLTKSISKGTNNVKAAYQDCTGRSLDSTATETYRTFRTSVAVRLNYRSSPLVSAS